MDAFRGKRSRLGFSNHHLLRHGDSHRRGRGHSREGPVPYALVDLLVHERAGLLGQSAGGAAEVEAPVPADGALDSEPLAEGGAAAGEEEGDGDKEGDGQGSEGDGGGGNAGDALVGQLGVVLGVEDALGAMAAVDDRYVRRLKEGAALVALVLRAVVPVFGAAVVGRGHGLRAEDGHHDAAEGVEAKGDAHGEEGEADELQSKEARVRQGQTQSFVHGEAKACCMHHEQRPRV